MQQAPDCDMMVVHDNNLVGINGIGHDTVSRTFELYLHCPYYLGSYWKPPSQT